MIKIDHIAVISLPNISNGFDIVFGAHRSKQTIYNESRFVAHISRLVMIQRQKFGYIVVFDLMNIFNGLDLDWDSQIWRKIEKTGLGVIMHNHCSSASSFFLLFLNSLIKEAVESRAIASTSLKYIEAGRWC